MTPACITIRLTPSQQMALIHLISEFMSCERKHTELFQDLRTSPATSTTLEELLQIVSGTGGFQP